jgi:hypothetical protein
MEALCQRDDLGPALHVVAGEGQQGLVDRLQHGRPRMRGTREGRAGGRQALGMKVSIGDGKFNSGGAFSGAIRTALASKLDLLRGDPMSPGWSRRSRRPSSVAFA